MTQTVWRETSEGKKTSEQAAERGAASDPAWWWGTVEAHEDLATGGLWEREEKTVMLSA